MKTIRSGKLAELMGVTPQTVRKYAIQNKIPHHTTPNGQLFFTEQDVKEILGEPVVEKETTKVAVHYARSSSGDKQAINSQFEKLEQYYGNANYKISDKASGLNENRKGAYTCSATGALCLIIDRGLVCVKLVLVDGFVAWFVVVEDWSENCL